MTTVATKKKSKKAVRVVLAVLLIGVGILLALFMWLLLLSPGTPPPLVDKDGNAPVNGINEKTWVTIGGVRQGMFIRGMDINNPVLLFMHGGPGMPEFVFDQIYHTGLEELFTVCWWEQRGAGLSYDSSIKPETVTVDQVVADTLEVTSYLKQRFGKDKIYLMAHSGGTFFGIQAAAKAPELFYAYIGISQIARQMESEKQAYNFMLEEYKKAGNKKMVKDLLQYPVNESQEALDAFSVSPMLRDEAMHGLGIGTTRDMRSVITGIFLPVMGSRVYTLAEKINIWRGKAFLNKSTDLRRRINSTDLTDLIRELSIPVYIMGGTYDYTVSYSEAREYLKKLNAPVKGFYTFENSAHSPMFEEPEKFRSIVKEDILSGTAGQADAL